MGTAMDQLLAAAPPEPMPCGIVIEVPGGNLYHPLPLPAAAPPERWIDLLRDSLGDEWAATARWTLVAVQPRSGSPIPALGWTPVATAVDPPPPTGQCG